MSRRRRHSLSYSMAAGDPGKDLFAYLFLLIMVFAFMVLMSIEQNGSVQNKPDQNGSAQKAPDQEKSGKSQLTRIAQKNIAVLEERQNRIYLRYGRKLYDPEKDFHRLLADKRVVTHLKDGHEKQQVLYIEKKNQETITLFEYLETFQRLSERNVSIAFAQELL